MTTANEMSEKAAAKEAAKVRAAEVEAEEKKLNEGRSGKGTRMFVGFTRGKSSQKIQYENWDETIPESLPTSFAEVIEIHKSRKQEGDTAEKEIVRRWILGDNEIFYSEASDPVAEFVESSWPEEIQKQF